MSKCAPLISKSPWGRTCSLSSWNSLIQTLPKQDNDLLTLHDTVHRGGWDEIPHRICTRDFFFKRFRENSSYEKNDAYISKVWVRVCVHCNWCIVSFLWHFWSFLSIDFTLPLPPLDLQVCVLRTCSFSMTGSGLLRGGSWHRPAASPEPRLHTEHFWLTVASPYLGWLGGTTGEWCLLRGGASGCRYPNTAIERPHVWWHPTA